MIGHNDGWKRGNVIHERLQSQVEDCECWTSTYREQRKEKKWTCEKVVRAICIRIFFDRDIFGITQVWRRSLINRAGAIVSAFASSLTASEIGGLILKHTHEVAVLIGVTHRT